MKKSWKMGLVLLSSVFILSACGEEKVDPALAERQSIYDQNVAAAPVVSEEVQALIDQSYGRLPTPEEVDPNLPEGETPKPIGTLNPGENMVATLSAYTREELLATSPAIQINIYLNGIIRDEYRVAAQTLYGAENVAKHKEAFKQGLLSDLPDSLEGHKVVDVMGTKTKLEDGEVARHHVDEVIRQLNRVYLSVEVNDNFGDKVTVNASTYGINFQTQAANVRKQAHNFITVPETFYAYKLEEQQRTELNGYYRDTFADALVNADLQEAPKTVTLAGFEKNEEGNWVPSQMERLAQYLVEAVYLN